MYALDDIIVARATPPGQGGVGVIRFSGKDLSGITEKILGKEIKPRYATYCKFKAAHQQTIDQGIALYFKAPFSFTGEDVLELHGHGGPVVIDMLLQRAVELGARLALPGEFSYRAFIHNKIDLTQAEAIADLIAASSEHAARSAVNSLQGRFSEQIHQLVEMITKLRIFVEAAIDFPEEEIDFLSDGKVLVDLKELIAKNEMILEHTQQGVTLKEGLKVVISGYPNVGKSSLLNVLSGENTAIVSSMAGTTRDVIREHILLDGLPLSIIDTAGLRDSQNEVEAEGIKRAWKEIPRADRILLVIDAQQTSMTTIHEHPLVKEFHIYREKLTIIRNKIDLTAESFGIQVDSRLTTLNFSAKSGLGLMELKEHLKKCAGYQENENICLARRRHVDKLRSSHHSLQRALEQLVTYKAGELVADELSCAQEALGEITGEFRPDDLLGKIFSSFCIGK